MNGSHGLIERRSLSIWSGVVLFYRRLYDPSLDAYEYITLVMLHVFTHGYLFCVLFLLQVKRQRFERALYVYRRLWQRPFLEAYRDVHEAKMYDNMYCALCVSFHSKAVRGAPVILFVVYAWCCTFPCKLCLLLMCCVFVMGKLEDVC